MSYNTSDAVQAAFDGNPSAFQDAVSSILADKMRERIGVEKVAVAQKFFNEPNVDDTPDTDLGNEE